MELGDFGATNFWKENKNPCSNYLSRTKKTKNPEDMRTKIYIAFETYSIVVNNKRSV